MKVTDSGITKNEAVQAVSYVAHKTTEIGKEQINNAENREELTRNATIERMAAEDFKRQISETAKGAGRAASLIFPEVKIASSILLPILLFLIVGIMSFSIIVVDIIAGIGASSESGGKRIVQVALAEKAESDHVGGEKYWSWYGFSSRVEWCATFVSWCANECDYIEKGIVPKSASVSAYRKWYEEKELYFDKSTYIPKAGDFIIFENGMSHVAFVQYVKGSQVVTIEGNANDKLLKGSYPLDYGGISGYCTPQYPEEESNFDGDSNAEIAWNFFKSKGCSDKATAGILGNLQQESGIDPNKVQGGGGPGRGIAQWTVNSGRYNGLLKMADDMGMEWTDIRVQLEFIWWELTEGEPTCINLMNNKCGGIENFKMIADIRKACRIFEESYERAGKPMMEKRYSYAEGFYEQFK